MDEERGEKKRCDFNDLAPHIYIDFTQETIALGLGKPSLSGYLHIMHTRIKMREREREKGLD